MNTSWCLFTTALRFMTRQGTRTGEGGGGGGGTLPHQATRYFPLVGIVFGLMAAGVYWLGAQVWPTSVAVVLSMAATAWVTANLTVGSPEPRAARLAAAYWVFALFVKYNALMALTAASGPIPLPTHLTLGLVMVAGLAASNGLVVSILATEAAAGLQATTYDLMVALVPACLPATLLGIPGLAGLVAAIVARQVLSAGILPRLKLETRQQLDATQQLTEVCFYLGALATWRYV